MKLKTLIVDDEPLAHKVILEYVKDVEYIEVVGQCHLATEALVFLRQQEIDLIFLDINMPKLKGLDFLRILPKQPVIIITSAYEEYALESFELDVCDYLLKPFRFDRFLKATNKALEWFQVRQHSPAPTTSSLSSTVPIDDQLFIKSDKRLINIHFRDIYYLESYGNYVKIWIQNEFHLTPKTLTSFETQLPEKDFFRIHKSFIVNKAYINYLEGNFVLMKNGNKLAVGKNHRTAFKRFLI